MQHTQEGEFGWLYHLLVLVGKPEYQGDVVSVLGSAKPDDPELHNPVSHKPPGASLLPLA